MHVAATYLAAIGVDPRVRVDDVQKALQQRANNLRIVQLEQDLKQAYDNVAKLRRMLAEARAGIETNVAAVPALQREVADLRRRLVERHRKRDGAGVDEAEAFPLAGSPEDALIRQDLRIAIWQAIDLKLNRRERAILIARFGLEGREQTLAEVGAAQGVGVQRIRDIEARAMRRLKHPSVARKLRDFLDLPPQE